MIWPHCTSQWKNLLESYFQSKIQLRSSFLALQFQSCEWWLRLHLRWLVAVLGVDLGPVRKLCLNSFRRWVCSPWSWVGSRWFNQTFPQGCPLLWVTRSRSFWRLSSSPSLACYKMTFIPWQICRFYPPNSWPPQRAGLALYKRIFIK